MATLLHSDSRRLYSWWWDSHISPKNSKWLQENLTDMDAKVKAMIKLIEEDADSFARRAEMYYKKRPELMKLVEEFYRAYRALAERYDHATGELRHAHRTMAEAFPNQEPFVLADDPPLGSSSLGTEPQTPEKPHPIRAFFDLDDSHKDQSGLSASDLHAVKKTGSYSGESHTGISKRGLKQLHGMFEAGELVPRNLKFAEGRGKKGLNHEMEEKVESLHDKVSQLSNDNQNLKAKVLSESERAGKAENEVQTLMKALDDVQAEKEALVCQYQQSLEKLSNLEGELNRAQKDSRSLIEQASKAETEVHTLKEALVKLEVERHAGIIKHQMCLDRISNLECMVSRVQADAKGHGERAIKAEIEIQYLKNEISRLESEKEAGLLQYKQYREMISDLENKILVAEEDARLLKERADRAETEVNELKKALAELNGEKEAKALQYDQCLEKISKLESDISRAQEDVKSLNSEILTGATKLKTAEEKCVLLEMSNQSLRLEADSLVKKIASKDQELSEKHKEFEKLQVCVQDGHLRYVQVEATLHTLQNLHSQSQEDQKALALELKNGLKVLKELEISKHDLEEEIRQVNDENRTLNEQNSSSTISMRIVQNEVLSLRKMKERLEEEVAIQLGQSNTLQQEICCLKEEIKGLNRSYQALMEQVELAGMNPECFGSSVKELQDENSNLKQMYEKDRDEKDAIFKKLENTKELLEKNTALQSSLSDANGELEGSREKVKALQESCQFLNGEKAALVAEKTFLLSQLQIITESMQKLLEKNIVLENSLLAANAELEDLRVKSKSLDGLCQLLSNEKSTLLTERSTLVVQLENVEQRLESLEKRFNEFEEKYAGLEKEKESTHSQVEELKVSLGVEKQERESLTLWSETQLASLENHIDLLQEDSWWRKKEFQEELDKSVIAQFEIFILQKFIEDMEENNYSLLNECQKHIEASKLADKLISELESENLEQHVEEELLLDEIEKLRLGIYQVFKALEVSPDSESEDKTENDQIFVHHILEDIENMKCSLSKYKDDEQQLLVENSVLLTILRQLGLQGLEIESENKNLDQAFETMTELLVMVQNEKHKLVEINRQLRLEVSKVDQHVNKLEAEVENLCVKQGDLQRSYDVLQEEYSQTVEENQSLLKKFSDLKDEKCIVEDENDAILLETLVLGNLSTVFKSFGTEKAVELKLLSEDLHNLHEVNSDFENEVIILRGKLEMNETENSLLKDSFERLETERSGVKDFNDQLKQEISSGNEFLSQREKILSESEQKLKETENLNSQLCKTVEGLKMECEESKLIREKLEKHILKLSEDGMNQNKEIQSLCEVNGNLESELSILHEEIEQRRFRQENLGSELQERSNDFELWEAEAATFCFDLQISAINEVLLEDKLHELTEVCASLEDESASKTREIEQMKEKVSFKDREIGGLKAQLRAYAPVIVSLRENIASLERNTLSLTKLIVADNQKPKDAEVAVHSHEESCQELMEDQSSFIRNGISDLQEMQNRIKAVEKVVMEEINRLVRQESISNNIKLEAAMKEIEGLESKCSSGEEKDEQNEERRLGHDLSSDNIKMKKIKPEISEVRKGILMKDIPLDHASDGSIYGISSRRNVGAEDQMLELWETAEDDHSIGRTLNESQKQAYEPTEDEIVYHQFEDVEQKFEDTSSELQVEKELGVDKLQVSTSVVLPNQGGNRGKILERLASDAQKLATLQMTVQDLRRKLEANKKSKSAKDVDVETVKEQLQEVEETVVQLVSLNGHWTKNIEESPWCSDGNASAEIEEAVNVQSKRVSEQARKGSEKIGRLQLELQKIQYVLLKLEDEKKSKVKSRFSRTRSRTSIILRDFIYSGRRSSGRRKKARLCGCFRPSLNGDGNNF